MQKLALKTDNISYFELAYDPDEKDLIQDYIDRANLLNTDKLLIELKEEIPLLDSNNRFVGFIACLEKDKDQIKELLNNC